MSTIRRPSSQISKWLSLIIAGVIVLLPFHAFFTTYLGGNFNHLNAWRLWKEFIIVASLPLAAWLVWREPGLRVWLKASWFVRLFALYVLLHFGLGAWALHNHQVNRPALIDGLLTNLRFFGFFIVCTVAAATNGFLKRNWVKLTLWPSVVVVVFGLAQRFLLPLNFLSHFGYGPKTIPAYQTVNASSSLQRIQSTLRGPNPLGAYLSFIIPSSVIAFARQRAWRLTYLALATLALFFTYSRSAWLATVLVLGLLSWRYIKGRQYLIIGLVIASLVLAGALYIGRNSSFVQDAITHTNSHSTSRFSSNEARANSLDSGWQNAIHQPLGRGPGTAGPASTHNNHPARIAENYYLQLVQEVGVIGLVLFVAMNALIARELWQRRADSLALILLVTLIGISFINLVSHAWADDTLSLLWWGLAGVACAPVILTPKVKGDKTT